MWRMDISNTCECDRNSYHEHYLYIYEMSVAVDNNILNSSVVLDQRFVFDNAKHKKF